MHIGSVCDIYEVLVGMFMLYVRIGNLSILSRCHPEEGRLKEQLGYKPQR